MRFKSTFVGLITLSSICAMPVLGQQQKRSLSVEAFDYSTVMSQVQAIFGTQQDIGRGIKAMLTHRITQSGKFVVVERAMMNSLIKEQEFAASNRVKRGTGPRLGEMRGAQFTIQGDIVGFGRDDRRKAGLAGAVVPGAGGVIGGYKTVNKAVVVLSFRLLNTETGETLITGEARGESKRESKGGFAGLIVGAVGAGGGFDMSTSNFAETIIGEATLDACDKLIAQLDSQQSNARPTNNSDIQGVVASVDGPTVYLNVGADAGVQVGDSFSISRVLKEVRDPVTKEVLDLQTSPIGTFKVTSVRPRVSIGAINGGQPQVGDRAEKIQ